MQKHRIWTLNLLTVFVASKLLSWWNCLLFELNVIMNRTCLNCSILCFAIKLMRWMGDKLKLNSLIIWALSCATLRCRLGWLVPYAYLEFSAIQFNLIFYDVSPMAQYFDFCKDVALVLILSLLEHKQKLKCGDIWWVPKLHIFYVEI